MCCYRNKPNKIEKNTFYHFCDEWLNTFPFGICLRWSKLFQFQIAQIILTTMIIFQSLQVHFSSLGIDLGQSIEKYPWNVKNVLGLLWFRLLVILSNTFSDAQSFKDYIIILNASLPCNVMCIEFALHVWKMEKIFQFIVCLDHLIQKSECDLFK